MAPSIGLNLRVTGYCNQGGRKYMEDVFSVAYQQTEDEKDLEYAYFGIFDGHGGREAAVFAKEHLMDHIVRQKGFWSEDDETVLRAIHEGFVQTHHAMWKELDKWPRTASGLPSTAGTTASIAFIRRGKIYIGHVGDSAIILGFQDPKDPNRWSGECLTRDHKPECDEESQRIQRSGGKVVSKSGVPRVVWNRPKMGHKGPVRRSTHIDEIPFLAVARSLGDLWSYNSEEDAFIVSPEPDTYCYNIDISKHRCLILGTDGCWNMLTAQVAVEEVCSVEKSNEQHMLDPNGGRQWTNPSKRLVDKAIERWNFNSLRADNTSVVTVMLDPPGPPRAQVLKRQRELLAANVTAERGSMALVTNQEEPPPEPPQQLPQPASTEDPMSSSSPGFSIISRFPNAANLKERNLAEASSSRVLHDFQRGVLSRMSNSAKIFSKSAAADSSTSDSEDTASTVTLPNRDIQCNEISSSEDEKTPKKKASLRRQPPAEMTPKLSRELSALKLSPLLSSRRGRTRSSSDSNSDTENEAPVTNKRKERRIEMKEENVIVAQTSKDSVAASDTLLKNPHFLRSKEAKVKKAASVSLSIARTASPTTVMSLRPRPGASTASTTAAATTPSRKRKSGILPQGQQNAVESKSPRMMPVVSSKPVMTRSRTARVLQLKK